MPKQDGEIKPVTAYMSEREIMSAGDRLDHGEIFMAENERPDQEPDIPSVGTQLPATKGRASFSKLPRQLSEEELSSPAAKKFMIDEIERLDRENEELQSFRQQYHDSDKECAVLLEKTKISKAHEIMYAVCLVVGSAALGYAPSLWPQQPDGVLSLVLGGVLIIGAVLTKLLSK